jgi:S-adenosylmethionine:tRNA ribosyltransferase-isomerase
VSIAAPPPALEAHEPPEVRARGRDDVALLVARRDEGSIAHARFRDLPVVLEPGDLLVVNTSRTLAAALAARLAGRPAELRLSTPGDDGTWVVELRTAGGGQLLHPPIGTRVDLPGQARAELLAPWLGSPRLSVARLELAMPVAAYLERHGRPIRYGYVPSEWPIDAYQTVFAREPGSAEMPSAGRPFTPAIVTELVSRGVLIAPITLHAGVSSPEPGEPPLRERYRVPATTARLVGAVRSLGGRVIAVGTTVVRALESAADAGGTPAEGWTNLVITPERGLRVVDGLLTGFHDPESSHLQMLGAIAGDELIELIYHAARSNGYMFHEFGDVNLILP